MNKILKLISTSILVFSLFLNVASAASFNNVWNNFSTKIFCGVTNIFSNTSSSSDKCNSLNPVIKTKVNSATAPLVEEIKNLQTELNTSKNISNKNIISTSSTSTISVTSPAGERIVYVQVPTNIISTNNLKDAFTSANLVNTISNYVPVLGPQGAAGANGTNGVNGTNGTNGKDGSYISLISQGPTSTTYFMFDPNTRSTSTMVVANSDTLFTNNLNTTNATSSSLFSNVLNAVTSVFTNLFATNATVTNLVSTNSTSSNLFSNNLNVNNSTSSSLFTNVLYSITSSFTNLFATNATITNLTATNLNTNNNLSLNGNIITSNVGGSTGTSSVISLNRLSLNGTVLTSTVNGVSTSTDLNSLVATGSISSNNNSISSTLNGNVSNANIINSNVASSSGNTFKNIINGIVSNTVNIINSLTQSISGNVLTTNVNGVIATSSIISSHSLSLNGTTLTSSVNGVSTSTDLSTLKPTFDANNSFMIGGAISTTTNYSSVFVGTSSGIGATSAYQSNFIGGNSGIGATYANNSNFIGSAAGYQATNAAGSQFIGTGAGFQSAYASYSNFIGSNSGASATNAQLSNFIGQSAGYYATNASSSNFFGNQAGNGAANASYSNFFGPYAGYNASGASNSNFFGNDTGFGSSNASYSNIFGYNSGAYFTNNNIGSNNIIIGTNISLPNATANAINLGGVLFGTGANSTISGNPVTSAMSGGKIGIGIVTPNHKLDVNGNIGIAANGYLNFGSTDGTNGYGIRDNSGSIQYKNNTGAWTDLLTTNSISLNGTTLTSRVNGVSTSTDLSSIKPSLDSNNSLMIGGGVSTSTNHDSFFVGNYSGIGANNSSNSNFLGIWSGGGATNAYNSNFFGQQAGLNATGANNSNFLGQGAGQSATNAYLSNFLGNSAGSGATGANNSNFLGSNAGSNATSASLSNFIGENAGDTAVNATVSNFIGYYSGYQASNAARSNFIGNSAGSGATSASRSNFIGDSTGYQAINSSYSNFLGSQAGQMSTNAANSNFFGQRAGMQASNAANSIFIGQNSGNGDTVNNTSNGLSSILIGSFTNTGGYSNSILLGSGIQGSPISNTKANQFMLAPSITDIAIRGVDYAFPSSQGTSGQILVNNGNGNLSWSTPTTGVASLLGNGSFVVGSGYTGNANSTFIGNQAGLNASNASQSNFIGYQAGDGATNAAGSNFYGNQAGYYATNAGSSNFFGNAAGYFGTNSNFSNFFGNMAGTSAANASYSNLFGYHAGNEYTSGIHMGSNNIVIGTNISLPNATANAINLGGVLFGTGTQSDANATDPYTTAVSGGKIGIGIVTPNHTLDVNGNIGLATSSYINFGSTDGTNGYGIKDASGTLQYKNSGGSWANLGSGSGSLSLDSNNSLMVGGASSVSGNRNSNFLGQNAGSNATNANNSNFLGNNSGVNATNAYLSNFLGAYSGLNASNADHSNFFGIRAGDTAINANNSNFFGQEAGHNATNASVSNFIGYGSGYGATNAANSVFIGRESGYQDTVNNTSNGLSSILIGNYTSTGGYSNSIAIGQSAVNTKGDQFLITPSITDISIRGVDYTFPSSQGTSGQTLINDGNGNLSWSSSGSGSVTGSIYSGDPNAISAPTNINATQTCNNGCNYTANNWNHNYRIYSYKNINGTIYYSSDYLTLPSDFIDNGSGNGYDITVSWTASPNADGYRILKYDPNYNGYNYNAGYDTADTSIIDDGCGGVCFDGSYDVSPSASSYKTSLNLLTSVLNGSVSTATIINSNVASSTNNFLETMVNGVSSGLVSLVKTNTLSLSGSTLTSSVNGVSTTVDLSSLGGNLSKVPQSTNYVGTILWMDSYTVQGDGTKFLSTFRIGDTITITGPLGTNSSVIAQIYNDNTLITVDSWDYLGCDSGCTYSNAYPSPNILSVLPAGVTIGADTNGLNYKDALNVFGKTSYQGNTNNNQVFEIQNNGNINAYGTVYDYWHNTGNNTQNQTMGLDQWGNFYLYGTQMDWSNPDNGFSQNQTFWVGNDGSLGAQGGQYNSYRQRYESNQTLELDNNGSFYLYGSNYNNNNHYYNQNQTFYIGSQGDFTFTGAQQNYNGDWTNNDIFHINNFGNANFYGITQDQDGNINQNNTLTISGNGSFELMASNSNYGPNHNSYGGWDTLYIDPNGNFNFSGITQNQDGNPSQSNTLNISSNGSFELMGTGNFGNGNAFSGDDTMNVSNTGNFQLTGSLNDGNGGNSQVQTLNINENGDFNLNRTAVYGGNTHTKPAFSVTGIDNLPAPTNEQVSIDYNGNGDQYANNWTHEYRIYSYKTVNGTRVYSSTYLDSGSVTDDNSEVGYIINISWDSVLNADGYRILKKDDIRGYNFDAGYDTTNTSFIDDACGNICFDSSLADVSNTNGQDNLATVYGNTLLSGTNRYLNFGTTTDSLGYGIRDNNGILEYKNSGGSWSALGSGNGGGWSGGSVGGDITGTSINITGSSTNIEAPTNLLVSQINGDNDNYFADGEIHNYKVYAYKIIDGYRVYSSSFATLSSDFVDNLSNSYYSLRISWNSVLGADGYRILSYDPNYNGYNYDVGYDTTGTSFIDNGGCGNVCFNTLQSATFVTPVISYVNNNNINGNVSIDGQLNISKSLIIGSTTISTNSNGDLSISNTTLVPMSLDTSVSIGNNAGHGSSNMSGVNFIGTGAGSSSHNINSSNFIGSDAGQNANNISNSTFLGFMSGMYASNAASSNFIGISAGNSATNANSSNFIGGYAGSNTVYDNDSNFIGSNAGQYAVNSGYSNFFGVQAGKQASNSINSNFIGNGAGYGASNSLGSNFIGTNAGSIASSSPYSNFFGSNAGNYLSNSPYSNLFGYNVGSAQSGNFIGRNNIIIGTNISLPSGTVSSINLGGVLFGTGTQSDVYTSTPYITPTFGGKIGIGVVSPAYTLDVYGGTSTVARFANTGTTTSCIINPSNTGGISCSSDINLKKNIISIKDNTPFTLTLVDLTSTSSTITNSSSTPILDKLNTLEPVFYNWKTENDTDPKHAGFIAQQTEQIFPDLVTTDNVSNLKSVNYVGFIPYLVEAMHELYSKISADIVEFKNVIVNTLTAKEVDTDKMCVKKSNGDKICITGDQLQKLLNNQIVNSAIVSGSSSSDNVSNSSSSVVSLESINDISTSTTIISTSTDISSDPVATTTENIVSDTASSTISQ